MKKIIKQWKQKIQNVNLTASEKNEAKNEILAFINANPVRNTKSMRHIQYWEENIFQVLFLKRKYMFASLAVILALALGGGTSFAAEQAIPGDTLYKIKVHVNEPVREILNITPETKAEWQGKKIERRLDEISQLSSRGTLDATTTADLAKLISLQIAEFKKSVDDVKNKKGAEIALEIEGNTEANIRAKEILFDKRKNNLKIPVIITLPTSSLDVSTSTMTASSSAKSDFMKKASDNKKENALRKINDAEKKMSELNNVDLLKTAMSILSLANETIKKGDDLYANKNYSEAFFTYQRAHELAQTAKLLTNSSKNKKLPLIKFESITPSSTIKSTGTIQIPVEIKIKLDDDKNEIKMELKNNRRDKPNNEIIEKIEKNNRGYNYNKENND